MVLEAETHFCGDTCPHEDRTAEGYIGVDDHHFRFIGLAHTRW
jgi:hypothetical protein